MTRDTGFIVDNDTQAELDKISRKLKSESNLNQQELLELLYAIECEDLAMHDILCIVHATLDTNNHESIQSLRAVMMEWVKSNLPHLVF